MSIEPAASQPDKEQLRQREIAAQVAALRAPVTATRIAAIRRLGDMRAGVDPLLGALLDPNEQVRAAAAMALGAFSEDSRAPVIVDDLLSAIDDPSERVCQAAIRSLGLLKARAAEGEIEDFLDDPNAHIAGAAVLALARLVGPGSKDQAARSAQLSAFLLHGSIYVRTQAVRALTLLHDYSAGPALIQMLETTRAERHASQQQAQSDFDKLPLDFHPDAHYALQNQLVRAAGELRLQEAVPILIEIAQKDIGLRGLAVEALINIGAEIQAEMLTGLLHDPSAFLRRRLIALMAQRNYTPALPLLRGLLKDDSVTTRGAALQALTQMRDTEALPAIAWIAQYDSNPFLRVQALGSLITLKSTEALPLMVSLSADPNFEIRRIIIDRLLEWNLPDESVLVPLARFSRDFPDDERAPRILALLQSRGFDPARLDSLTGGSLANGSAASENPDASLPPDMIPDAGLLLSLLRRWQQHLESQAELNIESPQAQHAAAAIACLIEQLETGR